MNAISDWFMCGRKRQFETHAKANKIGKKFNQKAYLCPICDNWHLTKKAQKWN